MLFLDSDWGLAILLFSVQCSHSTGTMMNAFSFGPSRKISPQDESSDFWKQYRERIISNAGVCSIW